MDDALSGGRDGHFSDSDTIQFTADWVALMRQNYPSLRLFDIEAYGDPYPSPNAADLQGWMSSLRAACAARGVTGPDTFQIDFDWNGSSWSWDQIRTLQNTAHSVGLDFGVEFWAADKSGSNNDADWYPSMNQQAWAFWTSGIAPELYTVESFINIPHTTVPETNSTTFMWSVWEIIQEGYYPGSPISPPPPPSNTLTAGQNLYPGQSISSPNGRFVLTYQTDANLVLYDNGAAAWAINCWPQCNDIGAAGVTTMQSDGNFVVYNASGSPVWHTWTFGNPGAYFAIQDDGNLVIYSSSGSILWQLNSSPPPTGRWKIGSNGCYWDPNDSGPNQCEPD
jgi:hypothetical protein